MQRYAAFLAAAALLTVVGCDNRTVEPDDPLRLRGSFYAVQVVDETTSPTSRGDTLYAALLGPDATEQAGVRVNGRLLPAVGVAGGAIYYATADEQLEPGEVFNVQVVTPVQSAENSISVPDARPELIEPSPDSVYARSQPLPVSWNPMAGDTATLNLRLVIGSRTWEGSAQWSEGSTQIPPDAWVALRDSVGTLWASRGIYKRGSGLRDGFSMTTELVTGRTVRVTRFVTPDG